MIQTLETLINQEQQIEPITNMEELITPKELKEKYPLTDKGEQTIIEARRDITRILTQQDPRLTVITGPCSIDDYEAAIEYAQKLKNLSQEVDKKILLVMRTYFEKPRSTIGWKGLLYDPKQDDSYEIEQGLETSRKLLIDIINLGVPTATEFLNPLVPIYLQDAIAYGAIGARTSESQIHREFSSGLPMPVGFKNTTEGDIKIAVYSSLSTESPHKYIGISENGKVAKITTKGNPNVHIIPRGGRTGPNYDQESVQKALQFLRESNLPERLVIDCSHANSSKQPEKQPEIALNITQQRLTNPYISGIMLESYLKAGKGNSYGQSKTDGCIDWATTEKLIRDIYQIL